MTDLDAINRALVLIGVAQIGSMSDHNEAARIMSALLPDMKRAVLNEFPWTFATRIDPLVRRSSVAVGGYKNAFNYPSDALNVTRVYGNDSFKGPAEFRVANGYISSNVDGGSVEYTAYIDNIDEWPQQIQECLVNRLASEAATSLTGNPQMAVSLLQKYSVLANSAAQTSVNEENIPPLRKSEYINSRSQ